MASIDPTALLEALRAARRRAVEAVSGIRSLTFNLAQRTLALDAPAAAVSTSKVTQSLCGITESIRRTWQALPQRERIHSSHPSDRRTTWR